MGKPEDLNSAKDNIDFSFAKGEIKNQAALS
jgi:hypothetical protein